MQFQHCLCKNKFKVSMASGSKKHILTPTPPLRVFAFLLMRFIKMAIHKVPVFEMATSYHKITLPQV